MGVTTLSTEAYTQAKNLALENELIRKEVCIAEFNVIDNNHIELNGVNIEISPTAYKKILKINGNL